MTPRKASNLKVFRGSNSATGLLGRQWAPVTTQKDNLHPSGVTQVSQKVVQVTPTGSQRTRRGAPREPEKVPNGTYFCGFLDFFTGYVWGFFFCFLVSVFWMVLESVFRMFGVKNGISRRMVPKLTDHANTLQIPMKAKV